MSQQLQPEEELKKRIDELMVVLPPDEREKVEITIRALRAMKEIDFLPVMIAIFRVGGECMNELRNVLSWPRR